MLRAIKRFVKLRGDAWKLLVSWILLVIIIKLSLTEFCVLPDFRTLINPLWSRQGTFPEVNISSIMSDDRPSLSNTIPDNYNHPIDDNMGVSGSSTPSLSNSSLSPTNNDRISHFLWVNQPITPPIPTWESDSEPHHGIMGLHFQNLGKEILLFTQKFRFG